MDQHELKNMKAMDRVKIEEIIDRPVSLADPVKIITGVKYSILAEDGSILHEDRWYIDASNLEIDVGPGPKKPFLQCNVLERYDWVVKETVKAAKKKWGKG